MPVTTSTCLAATCGTCTARLGYEGTALHYETRAELLAAAAEAGWTVDGDDATCGDCAAVAECAARGHDWGPWKHCRCGGGIPDHRTACRRVRRCERCDRAQQGDRHPDRTGGARDA